MKRIFVLFLLLFFSSIAYGIDTVVNRIDFKGLKRISVDTALFNLSFHSGVIINDNDIANSIRSLFSTGYFEEITVNYEHEAGVLMICVKERPIIDHVDFYGNKIIKAAVIQKILDDKKIKSGLLFNSYCIFTLERELEDLFHSFGKFNIIITVSVDSLSRNRVNVTIKFVEGETAKVQQINIIGNQGFAVPNLLAQFKLHDATSNNYWWKIRSNRKYQQKKLLQDLETLRNFYLSKGYAKFCINSVEVNLTEDKKNVFIYLHITEGQQYLFDSVILYGNIVENFLNIKENIRTISGEVYSNNKIQAIEYDIRFFLSKHGYIQPVISVQFDCDERNQIIRPYVFVDIGHQFYVREIIFEGNDFTKDLVMRREIGQIEQARVNYDHIFQGQDRLNRLGFFKSVDTRIVPVPNTTNQVDVIYKVLERNTGNLNLSVGFGTASGINMQFGLHQDNILGTGDSASILVNKNHYQTYFEASSELQSCYSVDNLSIAGQLFYNNFNANNNMDLSNYELKKYGFSINYLYSLMEYNKFNLGINYVSNDLRKIFPQIIIWRYLNSIGIHPTILDNNFRNNGIHFRANDFLLTSGWIFNNMNSGHFPTSGLRVNLSSKLTLPGSTNQYYKIIIDGRSYQSLDDKSHWVIMNAIYFGYAGSIHKKESPFYDNFYAGGIGTIRGFRLNSVGPKAVYYYCNNFNQSYDICRIAGSHDSIGGNAMILFTTELIIPVTYFNNQFSDFVRFVLFLDAGTVWDTFWKNTELTRLAGIMDYSTPKNIRVSSGVSLKWMSPVGPVIFSYSKLLKKYLGDVEEPFQFNIGKTW